MSKSIASDGLVRKMLIPVDDADVADVAALVAAPGRVVAAVEVELAELRAHESRPGLAAAAVSMAKILDLPRAVTSHASAAKQLSALLETLHKVADVPKPRLAVIQQMTERPGAG